MEEEKEEQDEIKSYLKEDFEPEKLPNEAFSVDSVERAKIQRKGYEKNNTVFGKILRGKLKATVLYEDEVCLCFLDIYPATKFHALVIPKERIKHQGYLKIEHLPLLKRMKAVAEAVAEKNGFQEEEHEKLSCGFHRWPLISVYHLHLHVIFTLPAKSLWNRLKFPENHGYFYPSYDEVIARLEKE